MTVVAIDGPAGAGKSTVARAVARALGYSYLDTGAMYRAVALVALRRGTAPDDGPALAELAGSIELEVGERVFVDGEDVTEAIRSEEVSEAVSAVAAQPELRAALVRRQREIVSGGDFVIEGRDIASVVVPEADVKIFLTASSDERARRRARQLGVDADPAAVARVRAALEARDARDSGRAASPLAVAPGAVTVDSTGRSVDDVVSEVVARVREVRR